MHLLNIEPEVIFQALADPIRIRMLRLSVKTKDETCLCELADTLGEPEYKLSRHLKIIRQAGLLAATKDGRWVYHRLVKGDAFLDRIYAAVAEIPDGNDQFRKDMGKFLRRTKLRNQGRCRTESKPSLRGAKSTEHLQRQQAK